MIDRITEQPFCQTRVSGSTFVNADCFDVFPFIEDFLRVYEVADIETETLIQHYT